MINITVNNNPLAIPDDATVSKLMEILGETTAGTALAINGKVVRKAHWESHRLAEGDNVLLIKAAYGG